MSEIICRIMYINEQNGNEEAAGEGEKRDQRAYFVGSRQLAYANSYVQYANRQVSLSWRGFVRLRRRFDAMRI